MAAARKILVPVDGSACSLRALELAVDRLAEAQNASLIVINVQPGLPASRFVTRSMIAEHQHRMSEDALKPARAFLKSRKVKAEVVAKVGDPAAVIVALAERKGCSEIVMGNSGRGRVSGLLLGSVASKVIQLAPCPVTVVK
jgi:nucleotide-binding universal stress UspA family protein